MKTLLFFSSLFASLLLLSSNKANVKDFKVNPIIGDISFERKFGVKPDGTTNENLIIRTHLEYVEGILRKKCVSNLSQSLQNKRKLSLDLLHNYWKKGEFPKNFKFKDERKPCFIDEEGNICAVGYLIEQTTSRAFAEEINSQFQYEKILSMKSEFVDRWIAENGLTKEECAMIQPQYTYFDEVPPTRAYSASSTILCGLNLYLNTTNGIQIGKKQSRKLVPITGLVTGVGQVILGAVNFPKDMIVVDDSYPLRGKTYNSKRLISKVNIGVGTSSVITSSINLIINKNSKNKSVTWNFNNFQSQGFDNGVALNMTKSF